MGEDLEMGLHAVQEGGCAELWSGCCQASCTLLLCFPIVRSLYGLRTAEFIEAEVLAWFHRERSVDARVVCDGSTSSKCSTTNNVNFSCECAKVLQVFATLSV